MLNKLRTAAIAATLTLTLAPAASLGLTGQDLPAVVPHATAAPVAPMPAPAPEEAFGLHAHDHDDGSGLAPGQTPDDFREWLAASPGNRAVLKAFTNRLKADGVDRVVPVWQLVRTSSSWRECGAEPFEVAPADKWDNIVTTLKFVRDKVEPAVGDVEALSVYRNERLNSCSAGAPKSAHRMFFALDLTPVKADVSREQMIQSICVAHARDGQRYDAGLGFYSGKRFHVDSSGFRKWGPNGKGATSPCVRYA
jgi:hypothetical protein